MKTVHPFVWIFFGCAIAVAIILIWEKSKPQPVVQQITYVNNPPLQLPEQAGSSFGWGWIPKAVSIGIALIKLVSFVWHHVF